MNPYQPPQAGQAPYQGGHGPMRPPAERERLMRIASDQRMINIVVLAYIAVSGLSSAANQGKGNGSPAMAIVVGVLALGVLIAGVVFAVRMASALHGPGIAVLCAILLLIPCVGLLTLLVLNSQATTQLKNAGLKVGLLGADASQFNGWR